MARRRGHGRLWARWWRQLLPAQTGFVYARLKPGRFWVRPSSVFRGRDQCEKRKERSERPTKPNEAESTGSRRIRSKTDYIRVFLEWVDKVLINTVLLFPKLYHSFPLGLLCCYHLMMNLLVRTRFIDAKQEINRQKIS